MLNRHSVVGTANVRSVRYFLVLVLFVLAGSGCGDGDTSPARDVHTTRCITDVSAFDRHTFQCDGVEFKVMLTQDCVDAACGVIVDVHGWLSNPDEQERRSNLAHAAMENGGYIVVQPGELSEPSNWDGAVHNPIVFDFLQQAIEAFDVDRDRVHFTGFSQGGWMTWNFICEHADIIASAAPIAAPGGACFLNGPGAGRKVPILLISGTNDILIPYYSIDSIWSIADTLVGVMYDYGMVTQDFSDYAFSAAGDLVVDAAGRIDIAADGVAFEVVDGSAEGDFWWTRYTASDGTVFEHLRHANNHVYPDNPDSELFPEEPSVWFSVGDAILQFFIENPRKSAD